MAADGLMMQGARTSAAMLLTKFFWNISSSASQGVSITDDVKKKFIEIKHCFACLFDGD